MAMESVTGTPLCFARTDLSRTEFSVDGFLAGLRRRVGLDTISEDLRTYLKILQNAMMELIHADYADFVHLSSNLVGLGAGLGKVEAELGGLEEELHQATAKLHSALDQLHVHREQQRLSRQAQDSLQDRLALLASLQRFQALLATQPWPQHKRPILIHRLAQVRLGIRLKMADKTALASPAYVEALSGTTDEFQAILEEELGRCLQSGLQTPEDRSAFSGLLGGFEACDKRDAGLALFIATWLEPKVREALDGQRRAQPAERLSALLGVLQAEASRHEKLWSGEKAEEEGEFVNAALLTLLLGALDGEFSAVVVPSDAGAFHGCYARLAAFAGAWWRPGHPLLRMALAKFSLPIYFRLRTHAVSERLDAPFSASLPIPVKDKESQFRLEASELLLWALKWLWSPEVYLEPLLPRFWDQSLRLISQYRSWQKGVVARAKSHPSHARASPQPAAPPENGTNGEGAGAEAAAESVEVVDESERLDWEVLAEVAADAAALDTAVFELAFGRVWPLVKGVGGEASRLGEALTLSLGELRRGSEEAVAAVAELLGGRLSRTLSVGAGEIPRQYRWTRKEAPTEPSVYVSSGLAPLAAFRSFAEARCLPPKEVEGVLGGSVALGVTALVEAVRGVVESLEKISASLQRLKKQPRPADHLAGGMTDEAKIRKQLQLDLDAFRRDAGALGQGVDWAPLEALQRAVAQDPHPTQPLA